MFSLPGITWTPFAECTRALSEWRNHSPSTISGIIFFECFRKVLRAPAMEFALGDRVGVHHPLRVVEHQHHRLCPRGMHFCIHCLDCCSFSRVCTMHGYSRLSVVIFRSRAVRPFIWTSSMNYFDCLSLCFQTRIRFLIFLHMLLGQQLWDPPG